MKTTSRPHRPPSQSALLGDGATLRGILALAGPEHAPRLLEQVVADLVRTAEQLAEALDGRDWNRIRSESHVLISVAGTIGAMGLHGAACLLNTAAHERDEAQVTALSPALTGDLAQLIDLVKAQRAAA